MMADTVIGASEEEVLRAILRGFGLFSRSSNISPIIVLLGLVLAFAFPFLPEVTRQSYLQYTIYFVWIILAESWNLVGGYAGLLNLGLGAFFVLGAVSTALLATSGTSYLVALVIAGMVGAFLAILLTPTFRLRSDYFAIATLVVPFIVKPFVEYFGQSSSYAIPISELLSAQDYYLLGVGLVAFTIFGIFFLMRSRVGIALRAIGDEEFASSSLGINILLYKTVALAGSGFIGAVAGAYYVQSLSVQTTTFNDFTYSLFPIFMVVIGGIGSFEGPIVGALIFSGLEYYVGRFFPNGTFALLLFSVLIMVVAVLLPKGIIPSLRHKVVAKLQRRGKTAN
ncbi:MAG: branched-chain amino acid ABC transporter permease [Thaumarchaeota archaeon]|nr:branched-chain amino acid ABC transporter permease [Nitrososphaerota archaeon]